MFLGIQSANPKTTLPEPLKKVLTAKLKAVYLFFSSKPKEASKTLKELLRNAEINEVPTWMLQDTLIDPPQLTKYRSRRKESAEWRKPILKTTWRIPETFLLPRNWPLTWARLFLGKGRREQNFNCFFYTGKFIWPWYRSVSRFTHWRICSRCMQRINYTDSATTKESQYYFWNAIAEISKCRVFTRLVTK